MKKYKVAVYAICKNEEKFVEKWMNSLEEADAVFVLDTGSTDNTVKLLRERGAIVYEEIIKPWRFDVARNKILSLIPSDIDICFSIDLDEFPEKGWREKLERDWTPKVTKARYTYVVSRDNEGKVLKAFTIEKIHTRKNYQWVHPVHEYLEYNGKGKEIRIDIYDIILNHCPDLSKSRGQYLPLLELSAKENPLDNSVIFWLGREYLFNKNYIECIKTLKKHLELNSANWNEERSASMRYIAESFRMLNDRNSEKNWLLKAVAECPSVREPYLELAKYAYKASDWVLTYWASLEGLKINNRSGSYLLSEEAWGYILYDLAAISAYYMGLFNEAIKYSEIACAMIPDDERLKTNHRLYLEKLGEN